MNIVLFIAAFETFIRGHSIVWRNEHNRIVKQVVYHKNDVFRPKKEYEMKKILNLPYGYRYNLYQIDDTDEISYNKTIINTTK
tara:strand:+ start:358 stop:606 length:249 start_codon:yes stop_codon:yes gene_type:complete